MTSLPTEEEFSKSTHIDGKGRGKELKFIGNALGVYHQSRPIDRARAVGVVLTAIRAWLKKKSKKEAKTTSNNQYRRAAIIALADQAMNLWQYESQKAKAKSIDRIPMQPGYVMERVNFINSGKTNAPSGSLVHAEATKTGVQFDQLDDVQFKAIAEKYGAGDVLSAYVEFMRKQERVGNLIFVNDAQQFVKGFDEALYNTRFEQPYVVDKYGNFITTNHNADRWQTQRFNHSTLSAGKNVICAGMIEITNGRLGYIDNASGHYKPPTASLFKVIQILRDAGILPQTYQCGMLISQNGGQERITGPAQMFQANGFPTTARDLAKLKSRPMN